MCDVHPEFYEEHVRVARKEHRCTACGKPIPIGTRHVAASGKWDGEVHTERAHEECLALLRELPDEDGCHLFDLVDAAEYAVRVTPDQAARIHALTGYEVEVRT